MRSVEAKHATTETEMTMNARTPLTFGVAALGFVLMAPVHAAHDGYLDGAFIVARQDNERDARRTAREPRRDERRAQERNAETEAEAGRDKERGYGYGYERRQQKRQDDDSRSRDRR